VCAGGALESCQSEVLDSSRPACGEGPALGRVAARWNNAQAAAELSWQSRAINRSAQNDRNPELVNHIFSPFFA